MWTSRHAYLGSVESLSARPVRQLERGTLSSGPLLTVGRPKALRWMSANSLLARKFPFLVKSLLTQLFFFRGCGPSIASFECAHSYFFTFASAVFAPIEPNKWTRWRRFESNLTYKWDKPALLGWAHSARLWFVLVRFLSAANARMFHHCRRTVPL